MFPFFFTCKNNSGHLMMMMMMDYLQSVVLVAYDHIHSKDSIENNMVIVTPLILLCCTRTLQITWWNLDRPQEKTEKITSGRDVRRY